MYASTNECIVCMYIGMLVYMYARMYVNNNAQTRHCEVTIKA